MPLARLRHFHGPPMHPVPFVSNSTHEFQFFFSSYDITKLKLCYYKSLTPKDKFPKYPSFSYLRVYCGFCVTYS